jgi:uncharacterized Zn-binding protein involved in type VI secretion
MPGFLLHVGAVMQCPHAGPATIAPSQPRVLVSGQPVATMASAIAVAGCAFTVPGPKPQPCVLVRWLMPSARFLVGGQPAAVVPGPGPGPGLCQSAEQIPAGPPIVGTVQVRVIGS